VEIIRFSPRIANNTPVSNLSADVTLGRVHEVVS
jgi:hypothetical protein